MTQFSHELTAIADALIAHLDYNFSRTTTDDWGWENILWSGDKIRWAHLEKYAHPKASILHLVIMPQFNVPAPIYGFDLVELNGNITGMFLDFTPTTKPTQPAISGQLENPRPIPDWADFFSEYFVCCKPNEAEVEDAIQSLPKYLYILKKQEIVEDTVDLVKQKQLQYITGQRKNPQTRRMLIAHCGEEKATQFIDQVLFPLKGLV